ncbi:hypothetical protein [Scleromatobacter humisilvae]|uniref:PIN domain-containing protein n=1 Tax=Scleromatobacter humisilvae TaxID=2897159 RepID=A0A9X1YP78_9BURK|nr:hypothetical protein [Scleromatobacter humisilvae]MCK9689487.1 hypothetical protein [Scleromatobacter humisilvae]
MEPKRLSTRTGTTYTMPANNKTVIIDTCSLARLYYTTLRPVAGNVAGGFHLLTLVELANEVKHLAKREDYSWLHRDLPEIDAAVCKLTRAEANAVRVEAHGVMAAGQPLLDAHCARQGITSRVLSFKDALALGAAIELDGVLVTDEWPLRFVAQGQSSKSGALLESWLSVDVLALLEREALITSAHRVQTYRQWRLWGEALHRESDGLYQRHFKAKAPDGQR